jgi:Domain of unknown function (DUF4388)
MHLSGQLSDWSINDLLQIMQVTKKTGSLDIEGSRRGRVHFREGRVTGADLTGVKGVYAGSDRGGIADILYVLSTVEEGSFSVGAADGPEGKGWTVEEVLTDVEALQSLEGEVVDAGLFEANGVRLIGSISEPLAIDPEDWHVFVSLVPPFTFNFLETRFGRGTAVRVFHTLHRLGMAEAFENGDGEAEWLDRLAEGVSPKPPQTEESSAASDGTTVEVEPEADPDEEPKEAVRPPRIPQLKGVSAPASTTLTDGVYDEIRRLRSRVGDK